jgi:predicted GIY-YIG superfamily endonuclease
MEIKWSFPKLTYGYNPPAVYRMDFNNGYFYIGSSKKVKTRFLGWRTKFKTNRHSSKLFEYYTQSATEVTVSILEYASLDNFKDRETYYIGLFFNDPLCINRSPSGFTNTGLKPLPPHLVKPKKEKIPKPPKPKKARVYKPPPADHVWAFSKGVVQFDLKGNYIQSHKSMSDAAKSVGVIWTSVKKHINAKSHRVGLKGFIFKLCGDNSPVVLTEKKVYERKERSCKAVKNTITGEIFPNLTTVAKKEGIKNTTYFWKQLNGQKPNPYPYQYV